MEFVDGKPLAGPLPIPEALRYAIHIAQALEAAQRSGIVHRDLKPGNILVTKAGVNGSSNFFRLQSLTLTPDAKWAAMHLTTLDRSTLLLVENVR